MNNHAMLIQNDDRELLVSKYTDSYNRNGYSAKSVLLREESQALRFEVLTSCFNFEGKSVLDIGCGFGDINRILQKKCTNYSYLGIDLVDEFIEKGRQIYGAPTIRFEKGDFLAKEFKDKVDIVVESGIFNLKLSQMDNYDFIAATIDKAMAICDEGIAFNFLTERVNYQDTAFYYINPEKVLAIAYQYTNKVILRADYMPFDYTVFIYKNGF